MNMQPKNVIPMVIESGARGERAFDIYSLLLRERIVMLGMPINDQVANVIIAQLLYLPSNLYNGFLIVRLKNVSVVLVGYLPRH